jgi:hypothetical protein
MDRTEIIELARRSAAPAVTIMLPVEHPVVSHPESRLRLRALVTEAIETTRTWWGPDVADEVELQIDRAALSVPLREHASGLAVLATPDDVQVLHLAFPVQEEVIVDTTFATRQLLEGVERTPPCRVVTLDGHQARLYEAEGTRMHEVTTPGFPLHVQPPHEQDTPHRDRPIHEESEHEEHRIVQRAVDAALAEAQAARALPIVVVGAERELAYFRETSTQLDQVIGFVRGNHAHTAVDHLAELVGEVVGAHLGDRGRRAVEELRDATDRGLAVNGFHDVFSAATEKRGRHLVVEEGFHLPRDWVDGLAAPEGADAQIDTEDAVDDAIESVLLAGGDVTFVEPGTLEEFGHIGLVLRW